MKGRSKKTAIADHIQKILFISLGAVLMAISLELFLVPNNIIDGGIAGISIMLSKLTYLPLGIFLFFINLPFLLFGFKQIGTSFGFYTLYGITVMSLTTAFFHDAEPFTEEKLLAVLFGGLILGIGVGLVIRFGGSLDGSEVVAILVSKKWSIPVGQIIMLANVFIFLMAGFVFGWDSAMYSMFTYYIAFKLIDIVVEGLNESKSAMIISNEYEEISQAIMDRLGRSTTLLYAKGGYKREETQVIYCVLTRLEVAKLRAVVREIDRKAFIAIEDVSDVLGGGFNTGNPH
ncbi:YitT family protein [Ammoniphilus sp. 3BR4]|uniref:YitT family protein n=1 Tax=Ammoniphilus sp. 3BR4 TaxID=3158265 RepID=UPI003467CA17